jgi:hypothetical protein
LKQCPTSKENFKQYSTELRKTTSGAFEAWENDGIAVYVPKETIFKEMAAKIE